jgi:hypothetical protein
MKATLKDLNIFLEDYLPKDSRGRLKKMDLEQRIAIARACDDINNDTYILEQTRLSKTQLKGYRSDFDNHPDIDVDIYKWIKQENNIKAEEENKIEEKQENNIETKQHEVKYSKLHINIDADLYKRFRVSCLLDDVTVTDKVVGLIETYLNIREAK